MGTDDVSDEQADRWYHGMLRGLLAAANTTQAILRVLRGEAGAEDYEIAEAVREAVGDDDVDVSNEKRQRH